MKRKVMFLTVLMIAVSSPGRTEPALEKLGLEGKEITSMEIWQDLIVVGTDGEGVFYQFVNHLPDSGWISIGLEGKNVTAVYPHFSGPVGWGVTAGVSPPEGDSTFVYCSFMGDEFVPNSLGISDTLAEEIYNLAGFPDETICGEKFAAVGGALYRQMWGDSLWVPVYEKKGVEGSGVIHVQTREDAGGVVLAGGSAGHTGILLLASTDYGDTWEDLDPPGPALVFDFDVNLHGDLQTIFVSHGHEISRSLNGGESWETVFGEETYTGFFIHDFRYNPLGGFLLVGASRTTIETEGLIATSSDLGEIWDLLFLENMAPIVSVGLAGDGNAYFAIPQNGIYRIPLEELSVAQDYIPQSFLLRSPYPNPFNPGTTFEFSIPQRGFVTLTVYDLAGREIASVVNKQLDAGRHRVQWNAMNIPSGIYIVSMRAGSITETRKLTVLR